MSEKKGDKGDWFVLLGSLLLSLLLVEVVWQYSKNFRKIRIKRKDYFLIAFSILLVFLLARLFLFVATGISKINPNIPPDAFNYILPLCTAAMLVRIVIGSEAALFVSIIVAFLSGFLLESNIYYGMYFFISSVYAANSVTAVKSRWEVLKAGGATGTVNVLGVTFILMIKAFADQLNQFPLQDLFWFGVMAFAGGILGAIMLMILVTIIEGVFSYTTDFKLLELANQNTPVLRELMVQAPGTYHHSIIVGTLSEAASNAIGENGLYARVACLYHDIGKSKKPLYYVENQNYRENRHDKLTPRMSARVIQAHVKDGIEMARAAKLPQEIIDIIPQHHGTRLISFFYDKAKAQADPELETIDEKDFRYEGPKPQSRVAGIILLADGLEAITRLLDDPTPARIKGVVRDHINKIFSEGQLDETELTLRDLSAIANAFTRVLTSIFHQRIDYPTVAGKDSGARLRKVHDRFNDHSDSKSGQKDSSSASEGENGHSSDPPRLKIT